MMYSHNKLNKTIKGDAFNIDVDVPVEEEEDAIASPVYLGKIVVGVPTDRKAEPPARGREEKGPVRQRDPPRLAAGKGVRVLWLGFYV